MKSAVLEPEDWYIRHVYLFTIGLTVAVIIEAVITGEASMLSSTLPIFLIGITIGFSLCWIIELAVRRFIFTGKTKQTKSLRGIIFLSRYAISVGLLYFLFASIDIIFSIISCIAYYFVSVESSSKSDDAKRITDENMVNIASGCLIVVLAFCIGYFGGKWIGGYFGNAEIGSYVGLALGFVAAFVLGSRMQKQRRDAQKAQDIKEENLLRLNNDSPLF